MGNLQEQLWSSLHFKEYVTLKREIFFLMLCIKIPKYPKSILWSSY